MSSSCVSGAMGCPCLLSWVSADAPRSCAVTSKGPGRPTERDAAATDAWHRGAFQDLHLLSLSPGAAGTWKAPNPRLVPLTLIGVSRLRRLTSPAHRNATSVCGRRASRLERPNAGYQQNSQDVAATGVDRSAVPPLGVARGWST